MDNCTISVGYVGFLCFLSPGCVKSWTLGLEKTTETDHLKLLKFRPLTEPSMSSCKGPLAHCFNIQLERRQ